MHYALPAARGQTRHFNYCALVDGDVRREAAQTDPLYSPHLRVRNLLTPPSRTDVDVSEIGLGSSICSAFWNHFKFRRARLYAETLRPPGGDLAAGRYRACAAAVAGSGSGLRSQSLGTLSETEHRWNPGPGGEFCLFCTSVAF